MDGEIESGELIIQDGSRCYAVRDFIPRFVPENNYAENVGLQANRFRRTRLDSVAGVAVSRDRSFRFTGSVPEELNGRLLLDVDCGAGCFPEVALSAGARAVALNYSLAVDSYRANLGAAPNRQVAQGDIFALPPMLRPGGRLAVDLYSWMLRNLAWSKYWLRPITSRISPGRLFAFLEPVTPAMLAVSRIVARIPVLGRYMRYLIPVVNYEGVYPLDDSQLREWSVRDTFDMLAPAHDHPQRAGTLRRWLIGAGLVDRKVQRTGFLVARGRRASAGSEDRGIKSPASAGPPVDRDASRAR